LTRDFYIGIICTWADTASYLKEIEMLVFLRIKKAYVFECFDANGRIGQGRVTVWFFVSPSKAHELVCTDKAFRGSFIANFKRIY
jgi:hypothetical protein